MKELIKEIQNWPSNKIENIEKAIQAVNYLVEQKDMNIREACKELKIGRSSFFEKKKIYLEDQKDFKKTQESIEKTSTVTKNKPITSSQIENQEQKNTIDIKEITEIKNQLNRIENRLCTYTDLNKNNTKLIKIKNYRTEFPELDRKYIKTSVNLDPDLFAYYNAYRKSRKLKQQENLNQLLYEFVKRQEDLEEFEESFYEKEKKS